VLPILLSAVLRLVSDGKTFSLLLDPLRDISNPGFGGVIFRRTSPQIRSQGGLWDTSMELYPICKAVPKETTLEWQFPSNAKIKFSHLEYEKNIYDWQGSQIPFIGFDELPHFTEKMFFYLLSRNRSLCGVKPYVRATCNPDPESWVAKLVEWWIGDDGFPIKERDGVIRYFIKYGDNYIWGDTYEEVKEKAWYFLEDMVLKSGLNPNDFIKSLTFISGSIYDNKALINSNPEYLGNLLSQSEEDRNRLLAGNWKIIISDKDIYNYYDFLGIFDNKYAVDNTERYITADIALKGSDKFVVGVWYGSELVDIVIMDKSDGKQVISAIEGLQFAHSVKNSNVCYDNDGVGGFIDGFIKGAVAFQNGGRPLPNPLAKTQIEKDTPENYANLKTQCYYRSGLKCSKGELRISEQVANKMYDNKMTVRQRFLYERKAIKRANSDNDGKLQIIKKEEMKVMLSGDSPDLLDMFMMREYFSLKPKKILTWA